VRRSFIAVVPAGLAAITALWYLPFPTIDRLMGRSLRRPEPSAQRVELSEAECDRREQRVRGGFAAIAGCEQDTDCTAISVQSCALGCYAAVNRKLAVDAAVIAELRALQRACHWCFVECEETRVEARCRAGRCETR
jgi:hypothetical protein